MTTEELDAIRAAAEAATPGPWEYWKELSMLGQVDQAEGVGGVTLSKPGGVSRPNDAEYMAAANPATVLRMVAEIERMRKDAASYSNLVLSLMQQLGAK